MLETCSQVVRCIGPGVSKCWVQIPALPVSGCVALASQFLLASILLLFCKVKITPTPKLWRGFEEANISEVLSTVPDTWQALAEFNFSPQTTDTWAHTTVVCAFSLHALTNICLKGLHFLQRVTFPQNPKKLFLFTKRR